MFKHKSSILKTALWALVLAVIVKAEIISIPSVYAGPFSFGSGVEVKGSLGDDLVAFTSKLALVNTFMHIMLLIILQFLGYLLQADFFNDPVMMGSLNSIWQLSRDIMNIIFALMFIGVSFYVIITGKTDKAKEKIVNFIVAVILVNFSWFFPRVILDIANVLTATVYGIPNALPSFECKTLDKDNRPTDCRVITDVKIFPSATEEAEFMALCGDAPSTTCGCLDHIECHKTDTFKNGLTKMTSAHAMINGLAVSFARITMLAKVPTSTTGIAPGGGLTASKAVMVSFQVAVSVMLAFVIQLALVLPLLGLAVGLFIRIIVLWITTAFMPFSFLGYVINGKLGTNVLKNDVDIWEEFINAAFLPVVVAIPIVIGFIMLSAVAQIPAPPSSSSLTIGIPILAGVKTWWQLLWMMAAVGIIWTGAFKALARSKIVGGFTEKIKGFGEQVFGGLAQAPLLIPLPLPGGAKSGINLGTLVHGPKILADVVRASASGTSGKSFGEILGSRFGGGATEETGIATDKLNRAAAGNTDRMIQALTAIKTGGATMPVAERQGHFDTIKAILENDMGIKDAKSKSNSGILELLKQVSTNSILIDTIKNRLVPAIEGITP